MNVRIDYESAGGSGKNSRRPDVARSKKSQKKKNKGMLAAVGIGGAAFVAAIFVAPQSDDSSSGKGGEPTKEESSTASAGPSDAPGLSRGEATSSGRLGERRIGGIPRGYPQTENGAAEAAATIAAGTFEMFRVPEKDRSALQKDLYLKSPSPEFEERGDTWRAQNNLNASGKLIDPTTGAPESDKRFSSLCHPRLGAYKVEHYDAPSATVTVWYPCLTGVIDPKMSGPLQNQWFLGQLEMKYHQGDWRIVKSGSGSYGAPPSPPDIGQPMISYKDRAELLAGLGGGWQLFEDASVSKPADLKEAEK